LAEAARAKARALFEEKVAKEPDNTAWAVELAELLLLPIDAKTELMVPTSENEGVPWRLTTSQPPANWMREEFDDSTWTTGSGGFGDGWAPGLVLRTPWKTSDIWLRRKFEWKPNPAVQSILARVAHDESFELFFNGQQVLSRQDWTTGYTFYPLDAKVLGLLKPGTNTMAVHCFNSVGSQYIDVGLHGLSSNARLTQQRLAVTKIAEPWAKLAAAYHALGDQPALEKLLKRHPAAAAGIGDLYASRQDWQRALAEYDRAITNGSKDARTFAARAEAYEKLEKWELAAADWGNADLYASDKNIRYGNPSRPALEHRALIYAWHLQQFDKQVQDCTELLKPERLGDNHWIFNLRGEAYDHLRQWDKALADFDKAVKVCQPNERETFLFFRARHFAAQGQWRQAADMMRPLYQNLAEANKEWWRVRDAALIFAVAGDVENYDKAAAECYRKQSAGSSNPDENKWIVHTMLPFPDMITKENRSRLLELAGKTDSYWQPRLTAAIHCRSGDDKKAAELFDANGVGRSSSSWRR
jgi:tetratricopeptide (TPR) repeat protein